MDSTDKKNRLNGSGVGNLLLPKRQTNESAAAKSRSRPAFSEKQILTLVTAWKSGKEKQNRKLDDFYQPFAEQFVERVVTQLQDNPKNLFHLEDLWDEFVLEHFLEPFANAVEVIQSKTKNEQALHPFVLHFPLFSQRQLLVALGELNKTLYRSIVCRKPTLVLAFRTLYDENESSLAAWSHYYDTLAEALGEHLKNTTESTAEAQRLFFTAIKSPWLDVFASSNYFELLLHASHYESLAIHDLLSANTIARLNLREDQLIGASKETATTSIPTFSTTTLAELTAIDMCNRARLFFETLPGELLSRLKTQDIDAFHVVQQSIENRLASLQDTSAANTHPLWPIPNEFPDVCRKEVFIDTIKEALDRKVPARRLSKLIHETRQELAVAKKDTQLDLQRIAIAKKHLTNRLKSNPWHALQYQTRMDELENRSLRLRNSASEIEALTDWLNALSERSTVTDTADETKNSLLAQTADTLFSRLDSEIDFTSSCAKTHLENILRCHRELTERRRGNTSLYNKTVSR